MIGSVYNSDKDGFYFISCKLLPRGTFVTYNNSKKDILCRVKYGEPLNIYPYEFLLDNDISADEISEFCGFDINDFIDKLQDEIKTKIINN